MTPTSLGAKKVKQPAVNDDPSTVKVTAFREIFRFNPTLKTQGEGDGHGQSPGHPGQEDRDAQKQLQAQPEEGSSEQTTLMSVEEQIQSIEKAIHEFASEAQSQNHGLKASFKQTSAGSPGLRVILSDVDGNVIRNFSGDEFLKLRKKGASDNRGRGKLLDQKL